MPTVEQILYDSMKDLHVKMDTIIERQQEIKSDIQIIQQRHKFNCPGEESLLKLQNYEPMLNNINIVYKYPKFAGFAAIGAIVFFIGLGIWSIGYVQKKATAQFENVMDQRFKKSSK